MSLPMVLPDDAPPRAPRLTPLPLSAGSPNRLLRAAAPVLECLPLLTGSARPPALPPLRARLTELIEAFGERASHAGVDDDTIAMTRYCLCTLVDETIGRQPWGGEAWVSRSLLVSFHHEASGGERFFRILQWLAQTPEEHLEALEFLQALLALGIEGRYRLQEDGINALARVRERLYLLIRAQRGTDAQPLAPGWQAPRAQPPRHCRWPAMLLAALAVLLPLGYLTLDWQLSVRASPLLAALSQPAMPAPAPADAPAKPVPDERLATLLAPEIARGTVGVETLPDRTIVTLHVDSLFASGRAGLLAATRPLLRSIGQALATLPGKVVVTGHSDNRPTPVGAPDNWRLSQRRADAVVALLAAESGQPERFLAQGRGASVPLVPNDTAAHRAQNRRVTITLLAPGATL